MKYSQTMKHRHTHKHPVKTVMWIKRVINQITLAMHWTYTHFFNKKFVFKKMSLKNTKTLKKMLRKSPAWNVWAAIFKNEKILAFVLIYLFIYLVILFSLWMVVSTHLIN